MASIQFDSRGNFYVTISDAVQQVHITNMGTTDPSQLRISTPSFTTISPLTNHTLSTIKESLYEYNDSKVQLPF